MERLKRAAIVTELAEQMRRHGSWCGETHLQKATFLLEELGVPIDYEFVLYKHGPFSFDLRDEMAEMRADGIMRLVPQPAPYGPMLLPGERAGQLPQRYPKTVTSYRPQVEFVAKSLDAMGVVELERLATALWVRRARPDDPVEDCAAELTTLKPHIPVDLAEEAIKRVDRLRAEAPVL
jgi:hypothetical protein